MAVKQVWNPFDEILAQHDTRATSSPRPKATLPPDDTSPAPGKYRAIIHSVGIHPHPQKQYDMVHVEMQLQDAPYKGQFVSKWYHLVSTKARDFLVKEFAKLGVRVTDRDSLHSAVGQLKGMAVTLEVTLNGGSPAYYLQGGAMEDLDKINPVDVWKS